MIRAELAKIRYLPLPRWTSAAVIAAAVVTGTALIVFRPKNPASYASIPSVTVNEAVTIAGIVFGVWIAALEFSANTMQRTLTAEPDRNRVLLAKAVVLIAATAIVGAAAAATAGGLTHLAIIRAGAPEDASVLARAVFSVVPNGIFAGLIGFGFGLLARSMGGGVTLGLAFTFVLSGILSFVPGLKEVSYSQASSDLSGALADQGQTSHSSGVALLIVVVWLIVIVAPAWALFLRADVK